MRGSWEGFILYLKQQAARSVLYAAFCPMDTCLFKSCVFSSSLSRTCCGTCCSRAMAHKQLQASAFCLACSCGGSYHSGVMVRMDVRTLLVFMVTHKTNKFARRVARTFLQCLTQNRIYHSLGRGELVLSDVDNELTLVKDFNPVQTLRESKSQRRIYTCFSWESYLI